MEKEHLKKLGYIVEKDSKDTTYKFALLRGAIDICIHYDHLKREDDSFVFFPMSLMIEKWIMYYYPLIEKDIPQKRGKRKLSFYGHLKAIVDFYKNKGGLNSFYIDFTKRRIDPKIESNYKELLKILKKTISDMPMRYLGKSYYKDEYQVFRYIKNTQRDEYGEFGILKEFYEVFRYVGTFISGTESILYRWAEFSSNISKQKISKNDIIEILLTEPTSIRNSSIVKNILNKEKKIICTWKNEEIKKGELHIDHLIPFSVWNNNSMWNLVPTTKKTNLEKKDKIPSCELIDKRIDIIKKYWKIYMEKEPDLFTREIDRDLLGKNISHITDEELDSAIESLKLKINYLINDRGFEEWKL